MYVLYVCVCRCACLCVSVTNLGSVEVTHLSVDGVVFLVVMWFPVAQRAVAADALYAPTDGGVGRFRILLTRRLIRHVLHTHTTALGLLAGRQIGQIPTFRLQTSECIVCLYMVKLTCFRTGACVCVY